MLLTTYNYGLCVENLSILVDNERPPLLLYDFQSRDSVEGLKARFAWLRTLQVDCEDGYTVSKEYGAILRHTPPHCKPAKPTMGDICMLMHTGGTTGTPKAAMLSYRCVIYNAISQIMTYHLSEKDKTLLTMPLFHTGAWHSVALSLLMAGGHLILQRKFNMSHLLQIVEREKLTYILSVPTVYQRLLNTPDFKHIDLSSLTRLRCGAAPLTFSLMEAYWERGFVLCNAYGMTEVGPANLCFPTRDFTLATLREKAGSVGKPMLFNEVRIIREDGTEVSDNEIGELEFRGPLVFSGYWNHTDADIWDTDGWIHTGDLAKRDQDGFYYIVGRKKNMYISGGENIFPYEIENILSSNPEVADCCVFGVPDEEWGEVGKALIVPKEGSNLTVEGLFSWTLERLNHLLAPRYYQFVDRIPRNSAGKLLLKELKAYKQPCNGD